MTVVVTVVTTTVMTSMAARREAYVAESVAAEWSTTVTRTHQVVWRAEMENAMMAQKALGVRG